MRDGTQQKDKRKPGMIGKMDFRRSELHWYTKYIGHPVQT